MDFIMALPETLNGNTAILVVVDKLSKYTHLIPTTIQVTGEETARLYVDHVFVDHGMPQAIVSDRDPRFKGKFMTEFLRLIGTKQNTSTAFHPQTDGQTERMNRTLEDMLRHYVSSRHDDWDKHLAMAQFAINNAYQESIKTTPFRLNIGKDPKVPTTTGQESKVPNAKAFADKLRVDLAKARAALEAARNRQKQYADAKRRHVTYQVGDQVLLSTKNIKLRSGCSKFLPRWLGPFTIIDHCGHHRSSEEGLSQVVAYKLGLPDHMRIHPVFHVSLLQPYHASGRVQPPPMPQVLEGELWYHVERILQHRDTKVCARKQTKHKPPK